jgi:uncharacterized membrane protein YdfJ with MMPL/SSD domain
MAGTGGVVTAAGLVFAATMSTFIFSDLQVLGQIGTTIGLGLLFDTLIVRSFMTPAIATLLGRWFWWPQTCAAVRQAGCCVPTEPAPRSGNCSPQARPMTASARPTSATITATPTGSSRSHPRS